MGAQVQREEPTPRDPGRRRFLGRGAALGAALLTGAGRPGFEPGSAGAR